MTQDIKQKIKESMLAHLKTKGYPDMTRDAIMAEVPRLWDKLNDENLLNGLIEKGLTFERFSGIALKKKFDADTMEEVAKFFRR
jgi:hypothetical protein